MGAHSVELAGLRFAKGNPLGLYLYTETKRHVCRQDSRRRGGVQVPMDNWCQTPAVSLQVLLEKCQSVPLLFLHRRCSAATDAVAHKANLCSSQCQAVGGN